MRQTGLCCKLHWVSPKFIWLSLNPPVPQNVALSGNKAFKEVIKLNEVVKVDLNPL